MEAEREKARAGLERLPLFPLPQGLLLPYELVPLHVFEPRYREMIAEVLASGRPLALCTLSPGWEEDYEGRPAVEPIVGVGLVTHSELLSDGRYNILLRGVLRARIVSEHPPEKPWREVRAEEVPDGSSEGLESEMEGLRQLLFALVSQRPSEAASALLSLSSRVRLPGELADLVGAAVYTEAEERRTALFELDPLERLKRASTTLAGLLVEGVPGGGAPN